MSDPTRGGPAVIPFVPLRRSNAAMAGEQTASARPGASAGPGASARARAAARSTIAPAEPAEPDEPDEADEGGHDRGVHGRDTRAERARLEATSALLDWADFGPLAPYLARETITDLFVNGATGLWVDDGEGLARADDWRGDERSMRELAVRLISLGGRHIDETTPCVDVRLRHGIRVHAVLPPISTTGTLLSIRVPRREHFQLGGLARAGMLSAQQLDRLRAAIAARENLLITGAGGTGKTTLLSAILAAAPVGERIVAIEDVAEVSLSIPA